MIGGMFSAGDGNLSGAGRIVVRTGRLVLRPVLEADREGFVAMERESAGHFRPWMPTPLPGTTPEGIFETALDRCRRGDATGETLLRLGATHEGEVVGVFTLGQVFRGSLRGAYLGWRIGVRSTGKGFATEGVLGMLDAAFSEEPLGLGLHRVQANIIPENPPSLRVAQKAGFRREGYARAYLHIGGEWRDHVMLAKLTEEHEITGRVSRE